MRPPLEKRTKSASENVRSALLNGGIVVLLAISGCYFPVREKIDRDVCELSKQPFDAGQPQEPVRPPTMPPASEEGIQRTTFCPSSERAPDRVGVDLPFDPATYLDAEEIDHIMLADGLAKHQAKDSTSEKYDPFKDLRVGIPQALQVPSDLLPGGPPRPFDLGPPGSDQRRERLRKEFPPLRPPGPDYRGEDGPFEHPLTLTELQRLGLSNSPLIKQAVARVETLRNVAVQAGLPPNPTIGFEDDTFGTTGGAGYVGGFIEQLFVTGGKLRLRRAIAAMDLANAEVALRRAQMDLATQIRTNYFQLLVARENMRVNRLLMAFSNSLYEVQAREMRSRAELNVAPYEPRYLRYLANVAQTNLITARNSYLMYWKQLTSTMGVPGMPLTEVAGSADMAIPVFDLNRVWTHVGLHHTDVVTADNSVHQGRLAVFLAQASLIPDVDARFLMQKDYTGPPNAIAPSFMVSMPIPTWNRNQGGIAAAQAELVRLSAEPHRVRYALYGRLVEAYYRYQSFRQNLELYRSQMLPDMVLIFDAVYQRYQALGGIQPATPVPAAPPSAPAGGGVGPMPVFQPPQPTINDVVVAQQNLAGAINNYITNLAGMWQAVVDVTDLIQTHDMFRMDQEPFPTAKLPPLDLQQLKPLPPISPCSPLQDPKLRGGDAKWPEAVPSRDNPPMPSADEAKKKALELKTTTASFDARLAEPPPTQR
jgi:cobalt-zinc-cadmium efflux system outer membrane protein